MDSCHGDNSSTEKYVIKRGQRIFIDICGRGCGSGCAYCYVDSKNEEQQLLHFSQIQRICEDIDSEYGSIPKIISLCPNTEPLKSPESVRLILYIISFFISRNSYIQISTKEKIPEFFLREINRVAEGRIFINISLPYVTNSVAYEPGAAPVKERLQNFQNIKEYSNINACLYIKPFDSESSRDKQWFVDIIRQYGINMVCVGVKFQEGAEIPCQSLHDKRIAKLLFEEQAKGINGFVRELRQRTSAKIFGSSICCICHCFKEKCLLDLSRYDNTLCEDCASYYIAK